MCFAEGYILNGWKQKNIIPVYKIAGKSCANSYRHISLLLFPRFNLKKEKKITGRIHVHALPSLSPSKHGLVYVP